MAQVAPGSEAVGSASTCRLTVTSAGTARPANGPGGNAARCSGWLQDIAPPSWRSPSSSFSGSRLSCAAPISGPAKRTRKPPWRTQASIFSASGPLSERSAVTSTDNGRDSRVAHRRAALRRTGSARARRRNWCRAAACPRPKRSTARPRGGAPPRPSSATEPAPGACASRSTQAGCAARVGSFTGALPLTAPAATSSAVRASTRPSPVSASTSSWRGVATDVCDSSAVSRPALPPPTAAVPAARRAIRSAVRAPPARWRSRNRPARRHRPLHKCLARAAGRPRLGGAAPIGAPRRRRQRDNVGRSSAACMNAVARGGPKPAAVASSATLVPLRSAWSSTACAAASRADQSGPADQAVIDDQQHWA